MQAEITRLRNELDAERDVKDELLADHEYLQNQFNDANDQLEEANAETARLRGGEQGEINVDVSSVSIVAESRRVKDKQARKEMDRLVKQVVNLEKVSRFVYNSIIPDRAVLTMSLETGSQDKETLAIEVESLEDQMETIKQELQQLENENEQLELENARGGRQSEDQSDVGDTAESQLREVCYRVQLSAEHPLITRILDI